MSNTDPRLSDTRVTATRNPVWLQDDNQWDDTERDARDLSDIHGYHAITKVICVTVCIGWWVCVIFAIGFMVGGRYA